MANIGPGSYNYPSNFGNNTSNNRANKKPLHYKGIRTKTSPIKEIYENYDRFNYYNK